MPSQHSQNRAKRNKERGEIKRAAKSPAAPANRRAPEPAPAPVPVAPDIVQEELECESTLISDKHCHDLEQINIHSLVFLGEEYVSNSILKLHYGRKYGLVNSSGLGMAVLCKAAAEKKLKLPMHMEVHCPTYNPEHIQMSVTQYATSFTDEIEKIEVDSVTLGVQGAGSTEAAAVLSAWHGLLDGKKVAERAKEVLNGLGFTKQMQRDSVENLHDSWHMPLALAKALILNPPVLLLDEPTHFLDMETALWLCSWVESTKQSCVLLVKSNDEEFLRQACNSFIHLEDRQLIQYGGRYRDCVNLKKVVVSHDQPPFQFLDPEIDGVLPHVLQLDKMNHEYTTGQAIFQDVSIDIGFNSRIALMGTKGSGKSTLINILAGKHPSEGVKCSSYIRRGHFSQLLIKELDLELTVHQYLNLKCKDEMRSQVIQHWLSAAMRHKKLRTLTPGLKTALIFACLAAKKPHFLLIDDPTKSMDIESIVSLAAALRKWRGGFVLASNNVSLISSAICDVWICGNKGLIKGREDILGYMEEIKNHSVEMDRLEDPSNIREFYPQFVTDIKNADVIHPSLCYEEYIDSYRENYKPNCIPLAEYEKQRALVTSAPTVGLQDGDMLIEGEVNAKKKYRMSTDPGRLVGRTLLEVVHDSKSMGESLSDFNKSNVWVGPKGTVFLRDVRRMKFCPLQFRRNHLQAHKILTDIYSKGGAIPDDILYLLNMIMDRPEKCHLYHIQASFVPISQTGPLYMRMEEHLLNKVTNKVIQERIFMAIPYVHLEEWHYLFKSNLILVDTYNYKNGRYILQSLQVLYGNAVTSKQVRDRHLEEAQNFLRCLKNRVKHRMDYAKTGKIYKAHGSDLATQARFSKVNCVLQDQLDSANETKDLKLHEFL
uniref:Uncharacterized protein n=1 Tax=Avena sativa TaxID=4498 RepID=A0ACD5X456_AVESA